MASAKLISPMVICTQISGDTCNLTGPGGSKGIGSHMMASCWENNFNVPENKIK